MGKLRMISAVLGSGGSVRQSAMYLGLTIGEASEEQAGLAVGKVVEVFNVVRVGPLALVLDEREHEVNGLLVVPSVGQRELPEIIR